MKEKVKKLLEIIFSNKKVLIFSLGLILFLSLVPFHFAQANIFSDIFWGIVTIPAKFSALMVAIPLFILALAAAILYFIFIVILGWLKVVALSVPVIPAKVGVVMEGWTITQNLANMFLILILVFIGLATILRLREYEAKKLLPTLILVALLINFSPVLVGFVVDISNIVSNFFLNLATFDSVKDVFGIVWNYFLNVLSIVVKIGPLGDIMGYIIGTIILGVVIVLFFGYAVWIFFLVVGLLIVRIIYLWVLMILAPIAFLSKIFPAKGTPKMLFPGILHWDEWWKELVQWSIIAIPIGFFLFLSFKVLTYSAALQGFFRTPDLSGGVAGTGFDGVDWGAGAVLGDLANVLGLILAPLLSLILLHIGYNLSRKNMPAAAQGIISGIEKGMKMVAGTALVAATGGAAAGLVAKGLGGMAKGAKGLESTLGRVPLAGKALEYGVGKPISWATRGMEMAGKPWFEKQARKLEKIDVAKEMKERGIEEDIQAQVDFANKPGLTDKHRLQVYSWMKGKGTLQKTSNEEKDKAAALAEKYAADPHFKKEAGDVADALTSRISAKAKIELEPTPGLKKEMEDEISKAAETLSAEVEMKPVIDEEATRLLKQGTVKTQTEAQQLAAKNVAARYVHFTELKSGDMKDQATDSITSKIAGRSLRDTTSGHIQAIVTNFKPKTSAKALDQTFNGMFRDPTTNEDYSDDKAREILENYLRPASDDIEDMRLAERHRRMFRSSFTTPGMREMNIKWKKYPRGRNFDKFLTEIEEKGPIKIKGKPAAPPEELLNVSDEELETGKTAPPPEEFIREKYLRPLDEEVKRRTERMKKLEERERIAPPGAERDRLMEERVKEEVGAGILEDRLKLIREELTKREEMARREAEEENLIKRAGEAISKKPARKIPDVEKSLRKDYLRVRKNVEAVDKDTKAVLAEIEKAQKKKDEETVKDLQKKYEDRQKELNRARAELRRVAIEYGKYLREVGEIKEEDKGVS